MSAENKGDVVRDKQVGGDQGDDVPDKFQLQQGPDREPEPYEMVGTHRVETRMSDEEIKYGIGRDARRAAELMHLLPKQHEQQQQQQQQQGQQGEQIIKAETTQEIDT